MADRSESRCTASRADGTPCQATPLPGREWCCFHDPDRAGEQRAARQAGGKRRSQPRVTIPTDSPTAQLRDVREVCGLLVQTIDEVRKGKIDTRVANTVGYLAGILVRALEVGELEERLSVLEGAVGTSERDVFDLAGSSRTEQGEAA